MKKKVLIGIAVALALVGLGIAVTPANAADDPTQITSIEGEVLSSEDALPHPYEITGNMFWSPSVCVQSPLNATTYPVAAMAQNYNIKVGAPLAINFRANCEASGYTPSRSFTVTTASSSTAGCWIILNKERVEKNGMYEWINHPVYAINTYGGGCVATQTRRNHAISAAIGSALGLKFLNSSGYNSRVVNQTTWSWDNVPVVSAPDAGLVWSIVTCAYGGC